MYTIAVWFLNDCAGSLVLASGPLSYFMIIIIVYYVYHQMKRIDGNWSLQYSFRSSLLRCFLSLADCCFLDIVIQNQCHMQNVSYPLSRNYINLFLLRFIFYFILFCYSWLLSVIQFYMVHWKSWHTFITVHPLMPKLYTQNLMQF